MSHTACICFSIRALQRTSKPFTQHCSFFSSTAPSRATILAAPASSFRAVKAAGPQRHVICAVVSCSAGYSHTAVQSCYTNPAALQQARLHSISQYRQLCCCNRCIIAPCRQDVSWRESVQEFLQAPKSSCVCSATVTHKPVACAKHCSLLIDVTHLACSVWVPSSLPKGWGTMSRYMCSIWHGMGWRTRAAPPLPSRCTRTWACR